MTSYHPEHFVFIPPKPGTDAALNINARVYPCEIWLHPMVQVFVLCTGTVRTELWGGRMETLPSGRIRFITDELHIEVDTLNGPLILEAAERQGISVESVHNEGCFCEYGDLFKESE